MASSAVSPIPKLVARPLRILSVKTRPRLCAIAFVATDVLVLTGILAISVLLRVVLFTHHSPLGYLRLWPLIGALVLVFGIYGLYPGIAVDPVIEIKKTITAATLVFLLFGLASFMRRDAIEWSRSILLCSWAAAAVLLPTARTWVRSWLARKDWWGLPVVVMGDDLAVKRIVTRLKAQPELGFRPVAVLTHRPKSAYCEGIPVGDAENARKIAELGVAHAILGTEGYWNLPIGKLTEAYARHFSSVYVLADGSFPSATSETRSFGRHVALHLRNNLLCRGPQIAKRLLDCSISLLLIVVLLPFLLIIFAAIKLESPGPALFSPMRYGYAGYFFRCWKFRTMRMNSEKIFDEHMRNNPAEAEFWRKHHKLRNDPRVTRFGKILRRTSLDEIPQLFNVLFGNMSLVGPRPISDKEIAPYGERHNMYVQVRPGITGLWQVSGRSNSEFEERMALDSFYVRNWSPWLDIYLLSRTLKVVLRGEGAY